MKLFEVKGNLENVRTLFEYYPFSQNNRNERKPILRLTFIWASQSGQSNNDTKQLNKLEQAGVRGNTCYWAWGKFG